MDSGGDVFRNYAAVYDSLYRDKDYPAECDFLERVFDRFACNPVRRIMDFGCGTGGHALVLADRGYRIHGIDRSPEMVTIAREKAGHRQTDNPVTFDLGDIQSLRVEGVFDAVISMFAVMGYQTENDAVFRTLCNARRHLAPGGLLVFDFWYGPAVLTQHPEPRQQTMIRNNQCIVRNVTPEWDKNHDVVTVHYELTITGAGNPTEIVEAIRESHRMRYFFKPEMAFMLSRAGFQLIHPCAFPHLDEGVSDRTWNAAMVARAEA